MGRIDLVVFDFDGTLAETRVAVSTTVNAALADHGLPRVAPAWVHHHMGLPLEALLRSCLPPFRDVAVVSSLVRWYRERFDEIGGPHVTAIPGAGRVLDALSGRVVSGLATSRESSSLGPLLERLGWAGHFASVATCDRVDRGKPDPALLELVLAETGVRPEATLMVGDTTWDVAMAQAAGVFAVGVPHGSHAADALAAAGAVVLHDLEGLLALIDGVPGVADGATDAPSGGLAP